MNSREQALGVRNVALQLLDDLSQLVSSLGVLIDLGLEMLKDLGIYKARHFIASRIIRCLELETFTTCGK